MSAKQKKELVRVGISAVLMIAAMMVPTKGALRLGVFLIPYAVIGWDVLWRAIRNILHGQVFDENFLMALATLGAFFTGEYPEGVAVMLFYQVGELFQSYAVGRSRKSIAALMDICPDYANIEKDGNVIQVSPEEVEAGSQILIMPGERIPLDGVILEGYSTIDTAAMTGESLPCDVRPGDDVVSGCINQSGVLRVQTTKPFGESTVARILDLVENVGSKKAKTENFITSFARYYTPAVVIGAVLLAVIPSLLTGEYLTWIHRAMIFLVISCPCALVISVPLSFFGGIGGASKSGIMIKGSNYMEVLAKADIVVFDKTGTLTKGVFNVTAVHPDTCSERELLETAALAEVYSNHPISASLREAWNAEIDKSRIEEVTEVPGMGIQAVIDGKTVCVGNDKLMEKAGATWHPCHRIGTTIHVAIDGRYAGHIVISDEIKDGAAESINRLKALNVRKTVMLTGDADDVGRSVAEELGIDEVYTKLLPEDKVNRVEALLGEKSDKGSLIFVGDGINDAPVLSRSDLGIAMGGMGSDAAIEAADVVLMDDRLDHISDAIKISKRTMRIARQNIVFALAIKAAVLILGALGMANMWEAVFSDVGVSVIAILNAMRALKKIKPSHRTDVRHLSNTG